MIKNYVLLARVFLLSILGLSSSTGLPQPVSHRVVLASGFGFALTTQPASQSAREGQTATFSVTPSGTGPFTYQWRRNGTNLSDLITTIAGTGEQGYSGDGGPAVNAALNWPASLAEDSAGNIFFVDRQNDRIRKINTNGTISTVAGTGMSGSSGDGGPATNAMLSAAGIVIDGNDNVFIAEYTRIRKIDTNGVITTVIRGDSGAPRNGFGNARSIAFDNDGSFVIADFLANRVQKIATNGLVTTLAGTGQGGFSGDGGAATNARLSLPINAIFDSSGNLLIADWDNFRVRKVDRNGIIRTVAGNGHDWNSGDGGAATNANIGRPDSLALDSAGNLFIGGSPATIRKVDLNGVITTAAGNGSFGGSGGPVHYATDAQFSTPTSVTIARNGDLLVADVLRIYRVSKPGPTFTLRNLVPGDSGRYDVVVTSPSGSTISEAASLEVLFAPKITAQPINQALVVGTNATVSADVMGTAPMAYQWLLNGQALPREINSAVILSNVVFGNEGNYQLVITNLYGAATSMVAHISIGIPPSITLQPLSQTVGSGHDALFTAQASGTGLLKYQWQFNGTNLPNYTLIAGGGTTDPGDGGPATSASLDGLAGFAFGPAGNLLIADRHHARIRSVTANDIITTIAGNVPGPVSGDGGLAINAGLNYPGAIAVDSAGNIFFADESSPNGGNSRVRWLAPNGVITTVAGGGTNGVAEGSVATNVYLSSVGGLAVDSRTNLFLSDSFSRIFGIGSDGLIRLVAGKETFGFSGDGGPATQAELYLPSGLAVDRRGALFIADSANNRVRKVDINGLISTVAGNGTYGRPVEGSLATNTPLGSPSAIAFDSKGNLVISDSQVFTGATAQSSPAARGARFSALAASLYPSGYIHKVGTNGIISRVAGGGGEASDVFFLGGAGVAVDQADNIVIADYWNSRIVELIEFGPTLRVPNVGPTNSGTYNLVVTSPFGIATSSSASLNVLPSASITLTGPNQLSLEFITAPNTSATLQTAASLASPIQWSAIATNIADTQGRAEFHFSIGPGQNARFYRIIQP